MFQACPTGTTRVVPMPSSALAGLEADLSPVVVYEAMRDRSLLWVRTAEVFSEPVATPQGTVPRFAPDWPAALACLDFLPRKAVLDVLALYDAAIPALSRPPPRARDVRAGPHPRPGAESRAGAGCAVP
ncbi:DUF1653 domain-containing protein [Cupriavidus basilensis]